MTGEPLTDGDLSTISLDELRIAYRDLRENHGRIVSRELQLLKAQGKYTGGEPPFGYKVSTEDGTTLVEAPKEQRAIAIANDLRKAGHTLAAIALHLQNSRLLSRTRCRYTATQIKRMIRAEADAGEAE